MRTSMPYGARIRVTTDQVAELRRAQAGSCLAWNENTREVELVTAHEAACPSRMIIASTASLRGLEDFHAEDEPVVNDDHLAEDLSDFAAEHRVNWPGVRAMTPQVEEVRLFLADQGVHLGAVPEFTLADGTPALTEFYGLDGDDHSQTAVVTFGFGFLTPTRVLAYDPHDDTRPVIDLKVTFESDLSHPRASRLLADTIAAALRQSR